MTAKKINSLILIGIITALAFTASCSKSGIASTDGTFLAIDDDIISLENFDRDVLLKQKDGNRIVSHHGSSFRIFGDTLIETLKKDGWLWHVSINHDSISFAMLRQGNGHNEFGSAPNVGYATFFTENGTLMCRARDFKRGNIYRYKIAADEDSMNMTKVGELPPNLFNAVCISDSVAICQILESSVRQPRKICKSGEFQDIDLFKTLNDASIREDEDFNILSTVMAYNSNNGMIVEAPIMLNTLLIYDKDCTKGTTICYGNKPMTIEDVMDTDRALQLYTFENPRAYDKLAAVLWIGKSKSDFFNRGREDSAVLFFDYTGHSVAKYSFDFPVTHFDFDETQNKLYVRAEDNNEIYCFDI